MPTRAVIFDLDDTLVPEWQFVQSGFRHVAALLSRELPKVTSAGAVEAFERAFERAPTRVFDHALVSLGEIPAAESVQRLITAYRNHMPTLEFYPDVMPVLASLRQAGIPTGIITDGEAATQRNKLIALNATEYVDEIVVTDELGRAFWKPHPMAFDLLAQRFNLPMTSLAYVGDNPTKDFLIGATHGVRTFRIIRERGIHAHLPYKNNVLEHVRINSLAEIRNHVAPHTLPEAQHD